MMSEPLKDQQARDRFRAEWNHNFAVSANAGSGKTTAISERLAEMALSVEGATLLPKTAVVTFTKKSAAQIGQRARQVLMRRLDAADAVDLKALDHLERAFFGTIHSFCLLLAQRYGQKFGLNLNPRLLVENEDDEDAFWEEFLEQDTMQFTSLTAAELDAFLRFVALDEVFAIARGLNAATAKNLARRRPAGPLSAPSEAVLRQILDLPVKGTPKSRENTETNKRAAADWMARFHSGHGFLPPYEPAGKAKEICDLAAAWMAPLKAWLADAAAVLAAELAGRYREYRFEHGVQTYADQIDAVMAVLQDAETLDRIRGDGWRVILDEAQDTDSQQFAVLVEITRPPGASAGSWPGGGGMPPRSGCFCMVGDGQQAIYRSRADVRNFTRHLDAFGRGDGGELLVFEVTFRTPSAVVELLNAGFPAAFGPGREHNLGLAPAEGVSAPLLQVRYEPLVSSPRNEAGAAEIFPLTIPAVAPKGVAGWLAEEARQLAEFLHAHGPSAVGAECWGEICVLSPRVDWLTIVQKAFSKAGLKAALQIRRNRNGDNPPYAWLTGLLAVICDPGNSFEWFGVLREVFAVRDDLLAVELRERGGFLWETPEVHPEPLRSALVVLRSWILRVDDEGTPLGQFATGLMNDCVLAAKAHALDAAGGMNEELVRLQAEATQLGLEGAGPRQWFGKLLAGIDQERPSGKPDREAINLLSSHSAKGLEWAVVIPVGFWRTIGEMPQHGLYLISDGRNEGQTRLYFDQASLPTETSEARVRERVRELVRLLYVTLTRASRRLVLPWNKGFGGIKRGSPSFAELWGAEGLLDGLPQISANARQSQAERLERHPEPKITPKTTATGRQASLPQRLLPHQLAQKPDLSRGLRHETSLDQAVPVKVPAGEEAIEYGIWWHETMENMPWQGTDRAVVAHCEDRLAIAAGQGMALRARKELVCLQKSMAWRELREKRWTLITELAVFSPVDATAWVDGVMDLVVCDLVKKELWILDWKTNQRKEGETDRALLMRLASEYAPQLSAYGRSMRKLFTDHALRLLVYSSVLGEWTDVSDSSENPLYSQSKAQQVDPSK
jgi:ATP-dependent exoDNAse (exonuclease V) beta subunit